MTTSSDGDAAYRVLAILAPYGWRVLVRWPRRRDGRRQVPSGQIGLLTEELQQAEQALKTLEAGVEGLVAR